VQHTALRTLLQHPLFNTQRAKAWPPCLHVQGDAVAVEDFVLSEMLFGEAVPEAPRNDRVLKEEISTGSSRGRTRARGLGIRDMDEVRGHGGTACGSHPESWFINSCTSFQHRGSFALPLHVHRVRSGLGKYHDTSLLYIFIEGKSKPKT